MLLEKNKVTFEKILNTIENLKNTSVHIIGDTIVDTYTGSFIEAKQNTYFSISKQSVNHYIESSSYSSFKVRSQSKFYNFRNDLFENTTKLKHKKISLNSIIDANRPTTNKNTVQTALINY